MTSRQLRPDLIGTIVATGVAIAILTATVHPLYQRASMQPSAS